MRKGKLNAPHPFPRPGAGLPVGSLRSISHGRSFCFFTLLMLVYR